MKFKSLMTVMAAAAVVLGMSSCGSDDAPAEAPVAVATQVEGSYSGNEIIKVMGEESSNTTTTYQFVKAADAAIDMTIPQSGEEGGMMIPALPVKNIPLTKNGNTVTGKLDKYEGKVTTSAGAEKAYTISNLVVIFSDKTVVVTFTQKYGNMPFAFTGQFTGRKEN
jgi:hypothetical protein